MRSFTFYIFILILIILISIGGCYLKRAIHYKFVYKDKVTEEIRNLVRPECLKEE